MVMFVSWIIRGKKVSFRNIFCSFGGRNFGQSCNIAFEKLVKNVAPA